MEHMKTTAETRAIERPPYSGVCPKCSGSDGYITFKGEMWEYCDEHKFRWRLPYGPNPNSLLCPMREAAHAIRVSEYETAPPPDCCADSEMERHFPGYLKCTDQIKQILRDHAIMQVRDKRH